MNVAEIARGAREILQHGWIQGELKNNEGHCLVGAMCATIYGTVQDYQNSRDLITDIPQVQEFVEQVSAKIGGESIFDITDFNDNPHTSQEDILLLLKEIEHNG